FVAGLERALGPAVNATESTGASKFRLPALGFAAGIFGVEYDYRMRIGELELNDRRLNGNRICFIVAPGKSVVSECRRGTECQSQSCTDYDCDSSHYPDPPFLLPNLSPARGSVKFGIMLSSADYRTVTQPGRKGIGAKVRRPMTFG